MKKTFIIICFLLCLWVTAEAGVLLGTFSAGDTFDFTNDGSILVFEGISANETILIVKKISGQTDEYLPISFTVTGKTYARTICGQKYTFTVSNNHSISVTKE
jgi:multidrug efflux pump subunit AcrB